MFIYRFKMNFEEQDGFHREIELRTDQTFLDFHNIISENLSLDKSLECTFFLCDHRYRKRERIYQPGASPTPRRRFQAEEDLPQETPLFMDKCTLSDYIDDPHQKFLYIYDINKDWNFYIELSKITKASSYDNYPRISASIGGIPMEINRKPVPLPGIVEEDDSDDGITYGEDDGGDPEAELEIEIDENEMGEEEAAGYSEEDLEEFDENDFYDDSIEIGEDFDDTK